MRSQRYRLLQSNPVQRSEGGGSGAGPSPSRPRGGETEGAPAAHPSPSAAGGRQAQPEGPRGARRAPRPQQSRRCRPSPTGGSDVAGLHRQAAAVGAAPAPVGLEAPAKGGGRFGGEALRPAAGGSPRAAPTAILYINHIAQGKGPSRRGQRFDRFSTHSVEALQRVPLQE